jgi:hypothetical protein
VSARAALSAVLAARYDRLADSMVHLSNVDSDWKGTFQIDSSNSNLILYREFRRDASLAFSTHFRPRMTAKATAH